MRAGQKPETVVKPLAGGTVETGRHRRAQRRPGRLAVALAGCAVLLTAASTPAITEAGWQTPQTGTKEFTAAVIPPPQGVGACTLAPGTGGLIPRVTVRWQFPPLTPSTPAYTMDNIQFAFTTSGLLDPLFPAGTVATTGPTNGIYTTVFTGSVLNGALGWSAVTGIRVLDPSSGWTSKWLQANASMNALGFSPTCTLTSP